MQPFSKTILITLLSAASGCLAPNDATIDEQGVAEEDGKADRLLEQKRLGAFPDAGGVRFGVWAPNAERVFVAGDFNGWDEQSAELAPDGAGSFFGYVEGARAGEAYQYVMHHQGQVVRRADPRAGDVVHSSGHSVVHDPLAHAWTSNGFHTPSWDEMVIYEMHLGTFNDDPGGAPGTWATAIERLDDLAALGVNVLEVLPPAEFAGDYSWGYNTAFPFAPESAYGTPEDAKRFIDEAHARGIAVLIDVVHNHWGPSDLPMWCFDGECYGKGGSYFYTDWRHESGWGPRPDFGRPEVRDYIVDNAMMWLDEYRADGLRWDSTVNIRSANGSRIDEGWQLLQRANDTVDGAQPWKIMIAEDLQNDAALTRSTFQGGLGFDSQWDGGFFHPIDKNIIEPNDAARDMNEVKNAIVHGYGRALARVIYTESHDEVANGKQRIPEMIWPGHADSYFSKKRSTLGAALVMTAPGIPMIFQGQEMLEDGWFTDTDPLDWSKANEFAGIVDMYKDLIAMRRNIGAHTRGLRGEHVNVFHVNHGAKVIAFHRWDQGGAGDDVVVVANFSATAFPAYDIGMPRGGRWKVRFNGDWQGYDASFNGTPSNDTWASSNGMDGLGYRAAVGIGPYAAVVLSQ